MAGGGCPAQRLLLASALLRSSPPPRILFRILGGRRGINQVVNAYHPKAIHPRMFTSIFVVSL